MSRRIFEYFFDPEDLEPFYSELPQSLVEPRRTCEIRTPYSAEQVTEASSSQRSGVSERTASPRATNSNEVASREQPGEQPRTEVCGEKASGAAEKATSSNNAVDSRKVPQPAAVASGPSRTRVRRLISVHALGQYVFCQRSAILSAEKGDQRDIDEPFPRFTYLPNFDREKIEEMLSAKITQLGFFLLYGVCLAVLMKMGLEEQKRWVFYPSFLAFFGLSFWSMNVIVCIIDLAIRRRAAIRAEATEPEPNITGVQRVNWWSMLEAGFEPVMYERPFQHPELPLEGSPWRVLQRGSRRIPVIKSGSQQLGNKKGELYPKHQVRLVAYALLLESTSHIEVPYGLAFPVDSPHGLAFPITSELRQRCTRLLFEFERRLAESQHENIQPQLPANRNRCTKCDYGKPVQTTAKEVQNACKSGQQLVVLQHRSGELYRCACADRFGSAPPHGLTVRKSLTAVVN